MIQLKRKVTLKKKQSVQQEPKTVIKLRRWLLVVGVPIVIIVASLFLWRNRVHDYEIAPSNEKVAIKKRNPSSNADPENLDASVDDKDDSRSDKDKINSKKSSSSGEVDESKTEGAINVPEASSKSQESSVSQPDELDEPENRDNSSIAKNEKENKDLANKDRKVESEGSVEDLSVEISQNKPYKSGKKYLAYQFEYNKNNYNEPTRAMLKLAKELKSYPDMKILITAYTDNIGSASFNNNLSELRAKAIYDFLISQGIDKERLTYKGMGISYKYDNTTEQGRQKNRRAEFELTK